MGIFFTFEYLHFFQFYSRLAFLSSSLTSCTLVSFGLKSSKESKSISTSGRIFYLFRMNAWHIVELIFVKTTTKILFVQWIFLSLAFRYWKWSLFMCDWTLLWHFSISNCVTLMHSIISIMHLLFLSITLMIGENMFNLLHLFHVFSTTTRVVGWFVAIGASNGVSTRLRKLQHAWFPWAGLQKNV